MLALHVPFPVVALIPVRWRLVGVLPLAADVALNIAADRQFKRLHTTVKPFQISSALVTDGVFRRTRNPMYLGRVLAVVGIAVLEGSVSPWVVVAALAVLLDRVFITRDEHSLEENFGDVFKKHRGSVRRWM